MIVDDLGNYDAVSYATEIGNKWGVGQSDFRNGIVILIKPTGGAGQRDLFIAVGYGLEGAIPDLLTKRIREDDIEPYFKHGDFYNGLLTGVQSLMKASKGEYNVKQKNEDRFINWIISHPILFILIVFLIIFLLAKGTKGGGGGGRTFYGGGFVNFGGGSSGFGGGGSSFGGGSFGGGSFGGGGSGGKW